MKDDKHLFCKIAERAYSRGESAACYGRPSRAKETALEGQAADFELALWIESYELGYNTRLESEKKVKDLADKYLKRAIEAAASRSTL